MSQNAIGMFIRSIGFTFILLVSTSWLSCTPPANEPQVDAQSLAVYHFSNLISGDQVQREEALEFIEQEWEDSYAIMVLELSYLHRDPLLSARLFSILGEKTGEKYGYDLDAWYKWLWNKKEDIVSDYADFKAHIYKYIDPRFEKYFEGRYQSKIRLDEVRWGGVQQDGIPPLRKPLMISAEEATYLDDDNIVFGIEVNGDIRAYPKRILAWHEMFVDEVGGIPVCGVYCTLCGTVILYKTEIDGKKYEMGTSGFLYRSNKLMYDQATQSLWNTVWGEPVIGPLVNQEIQLEHMSVVTTTWGEWRRRHPETTVLSLQTGHRRDYGEGVAYKEYFATDELMFTVPFNDKRLKNKDEVLALRFPDYPDEQLAISARYLSKNPVYHEKIGDVEFVIFTDKTGANRVYESGGKTFTNFDGKESIVDDSGDQWRLFEDRIEDRKGKRLHRLPYHRAFWFGWHAAYPNSRLVK